ncbi:unnamed protein product [Orchesella dallaii]|uniref:DOMON domain-containing protein n=1 Tax=Orchesella dallaii TaxID=48710 RepID=A0ABP1RR97_9HEXA
MCLNSLSSIASGATFLHNDELQLKAIGESLDPSGSYILSWEVDLKKQRITFEAEVATLGYIGLGISPNGNMAGADLFIGGVYKNGTKYGYDMHARDMNMPILDNQSDWTLIDASENESKTYLKFTRLLNTCDDNDYPISNDTVRIIWSIGETDDITYHKGNRGTKSLNLLMPNNDNFNPDDYLKWDLETEIEMPSEDTTYWCSFKKAPELNSTHHIIAFEPILTNELAMNYTHHFIIYKCTPPKGQNEEDFFGPHLNHPGENCYLPDDQQSLPIKYCMSQYVYVWSKGGKRMIFPEGVGYPFPEKVGESNYYLLEIHYDNPEKLPGLTFKTGERVLYTDKPIETDAELLTVSHDVSIAMTIPPNQTEFIVAGHCSPQCTEAGLSDGGINIFNSLLHSHLSGRKLKVRHFRDDVELPWLDFDNQYDFNFQQNKPLRDAVRVLPGDQLTVECAYSTTWNNHKAVIGGLSTREEMCMAFLWYYPKQKLDYCGSYYPNDVLHEMGVTNYTVSKPSVGGLPIYTIIEPEDLVGEYVESLSTKFKWNETFVREIERRRRYSAHHSGCLYKLQGSGDVISVQYPYDFMKYAPEDVCKREVVNPAVKSGSFAVVPTSLIFKICMLLFVTNATYQ